MQTFEALTDLLRILGDPTRLRLLAGLNQGELSVGEITQVTGLSQNPGAGSVRPGILRRELKCLCSHAARVIA